MPRGLMLFAWVLLPIPAPAADKPADPPWKTNPPIVTVKKELHRKHSRPRAAALGRLEYVGPKLDLMEWRAEEVSDDVWDRNEARWSADNGRTWSEWVKQQPSTNVVYKGVTVWEGGICRQYDPASGRLVEMWLRQIAGGGQYRCFTYYRLSRDLGKTWSDPKQLVYDDGERFDPNDPVKNGFLKKNQGYPGSTVLVHSNGTLIHCVAHTNAPGDPENDKRAWRLGSLCFIGKWDQKEKDYVWTAGQRVEVSPDLSSRGLMEPEVAELSGGRVLVVWRGSDTAKTPGRKWYAVSADGGKTLSAVKEWQYDDGTRFYSPSSYHRMIRHSVTKKLYWVGNICADPPGGNSPRYPLVIAEVDEKGPALKRKTVTLIDDRKSDEGPGVQFSNFSLLEDRETHELVLVLTTYGQEADPKEWATADCYRYALTIR